jgi:hypothetical protein
LRGGLSCKTVGLAGRVPGSSKQGDRLFRRSGEFGRSGAVRGTLTAAPSAADRDRTIRARPVHSRRTRVDSARSSGHQVPLAMATLPGHAQATSGAIGHGLPVEGRSGGAHTTWGVRVAGGVAGGVPWPARPPPGHGWAPRLGKHLRAGGHPRLLLVGSFLPRPLRRRTRNSAEIPGDPRERTESTRGRPDCHKSTVNRL